MSDLENNPHYKNGVYIGSHVAKNIDITSYGTIQIALKRKQELLEELKKRSNGEITKDVAETLGIIAALKTELKQQKR